MMSGFETIVMYLGMSLLVIILMPQSYTIRCQIFPCCNTLFGIRSGNSADLSFGCQISYLSSSRLGHFF